MVNHLPAQSERKIFLDFGFRIILQNHARLKYQLSKLAGGGNSCCSLPGSLGFQPGQSKVMGPRVRQRWHIQNILDNLFQDWVKREYSINIQYYFCDWLGGSAGTNISESSHTEPSQVLKPSWVNELVNLTILYFVSLCGTGVIVMRVWEEEVKFKMDVVGFYSKAMFWQIREGCLIQSWAAELLMNGKLDHSAPVHCSSGKDGGLHGRRRVLNTGWAKDYSHILIHTFVCFGALYILCNLTSFS